MSDAVAVPLWLVLLAGLLAAWAFYEHLLMPALRWLVMHPANQVIDQMSTRLRIGIRPFQRTRRQALIHRLLTDPKVQDAAAQFAAEHKLPINAVLRKIEALRARDRAGVQRLPLLPHRLLARPHAWRDCSTACASATSIPPAWSASTRTPPWCCVMNHRSNMDYVLAGFLAADQAALSYAVGEWARIWPLSALIRAMGAYFVRRNSRDELYRRVLERYIAMATEAGVPQAVYPEGGLTRDGRMREPKLGVHRLHAARLPHRRRPRPGVRAARPQLRPRARGPHPLLQDKARPGRREEPVDHVALHRAQRLAHAAQRMAPLRLRLRQLRHADLDARVLPRTRHRFPGAVRRRAARGDGRTSGAS